MSRRHRTRMIVWPSVVLFLAAVAYALYVPLRYYPKEIEQSQERAAMQPEQVIEIHFDPEKLRRGLYEDPRPKLASGAPVIVVQRNEFLVGEWHEDCACTTHPANQRELASAAEKIIRSAFPPESFDSNAERIFSCPVELASKFDWDWSKEEYGSSK